MSAKPDGCDYSFGELTALSERFGDRFFLFRPDRFRSNVERFLGAFQSRYARTLLAYSYKTNYLPEVCRLADGLACHAEVVSRLELDLALELGVRGSSIIFNGPLKSDDDIVAAAEHGALVHVDSLSEAALVARLAGSRPELTFRTGVRCAFEVPGTPPTRFGIAIHGAGFVRALELLREGENIQLESVHAHYVPAQRSPEAYAGIARTLIGVAERHFGRSECRMIDIGGGFFSPMPPSLKRQFSQEIPGFEAYGEAVGNALRERFPGADGPWLVLEPGLAVVADAFCYVCRVTHTKEVLGRRYAMSTGSIDDMVPTRSRTQMPITVVRPPGQPVVSGKGSESLDIAGYTCREDDILHRNLSEPVTPGDYLVFQNVGAYSIVLKPPFIRLAAPVIELDPESGSSRLVRRAGGIEDLMAATVPLRGGKSR